MAKQGEHGITWTDRTWNPTRGCSMAPGSEVGGCLNCYAAAMACRFNGRGMPYEGLAKRTRGGPRWTGEIALVEDHLEDPLHWRNPSRVFVDSMSDLFHEKVRDEWIDRIFAVMDQARRHTFQVLTKRPERMRDYCSAYRMARGFHPDGPWPLPNVWLGVSCENQETADARIPLLLQTPAAARFVSYEPALSGVDFTRMPYPGRPNRFRDVLGGDYGNGAGEVYSPCPTVDWLIVGGESGHGARPFDLRWAERVVEDCRRAGTACFVKQLGTVPFDSMAAWRALGKREPAGEQWRLGALKLRDKKGGDMAEWPEHLRVREFPTVGGTP